MRHSVFNRRSPEETNGCGRAHSGKRSDPFGSLGQDLGGEAGEEGSGGSGEAKAEGAGFAGARDGLLRDCPGVVLHGRVLPRNPAVLSGRDRVVDGTRGAGAGVGLGL